MARKSKIWYRKANKTYYTTINGKQHLLSTDKKEAEDKFHELMLGRKTVSNGTVVAILDQFLEWTEKRRKPGTYEWYQRNIQMFAETIGTLRVSEIKTYHVQRFIDSLKVSDSTKNGAWRCINRAFNWAIRQELMDRNPATNVEKPAVESRDGYVTEAEYKLVMERTKDEAFRDLLTVAWQCGARPTELFIVEARHVELDKSRWHFAPLEGKRGLRRYVYLTEEAEAITKKLMERHTEGPIFRNMDGAPWNKCSVACRFQRLKKHVGRTLCLYLFRHAQITRQLVAGVDSHVVAQLSGHRDTRMIDRVYGHAAEDWEFMRDKLRSTNA
jgi:site-specific recombinase XerD